MTEETTLVPPVVEEEKQPENDKISFRIVAQDGGEVFFKVRQQTPFIKVFNAYYEKKGLNASTTRFLFDGQRINDGDTPESLGMQDDDVIDALLQQTGG